MQPSVRFLQKATLITLKAHVARSAHNYRLLRISDDFTELLRISEDFTENAEDFNCVLQCSRISSQFANGSDSFPQLHGGSTGFSSKFHCPVAFHDFQVTYGFLVIRSSSSGLAAHEPCSRLTSLASLARLASLTVVGREPREAREAHEPREHHGAQEALGPYELREPHEHHEDQDAREDRDARDACEPARWPEC